MSQSRRYFLKSTGLAMASFAAAPSFLVRSAMAQEASAVSGKDKPILIAVFQRGAADGILPQKTAPSQGRAPPRHGGR